MSTADAAAGAAAGAARRAAVPATSWISWVALAMMTTSSVASLRAAPTMAVYGLACVFLYLLPAIVFLLPTSLVSAELASGWDGGIYNWVSEGISKPAGFLAVWCQFAMTIFYYPSLLGFVASTAEKALVSHLRHAAPWGVHVSVEVEATGPPFLATTDGPAYAAMARAMQDAYGEPMATLGQGGSIPLCNVLAETYPAAEIILMGVEEPLALIHAPNESVDPGEIARMAVTEALFLQGYAATAH